MRKITTDVLVVGGGGAALRAAIEASQKGAQVILVQKGIGSTAYKVAETAGYNSPDGLVDPEDNKKEYEKDIIDAALGVSDPKLVSILAHGARDTVEYLEEHGVPFEYDGEHYLEVVGCFATRPRMHIIKGHGEPIVKALREIVNREEIQLMTNIMVTKIFTKDSKVTGALCLDFNNEEIFYIQCKAIILGTGGAGQLFKLNHNPPDITGDGYMLALEAGAELVNMEFMQSGLGTVKPIKVNFNNWIWAGFPKILNKHGQEFLQNYLPADVTLEQAMNDKSKHYPFSSRDLSKYIEEGIHKEIKKGNGTENQGVYVDLSPLMNMPLEEMPDHMRKLWPLTRKFWEDHHIDLSKDKIEISTFGHAINGGVKIDENGKSIIDGLYAAGETAGGPHGADRLGGNMLVTCQVFGLRAGQHAAHYAQKQDFLAVDENALKEEVDKVKGVVDNSGGFALRQIKEELQELMWNNYLVVKNQETLNKIKEGLGYLKNSLQEARIESFRDMRVYLEVQNMLTLAEIMAAAALLRKESRGSHYRDDYELLRDEFAQPIIVTRDKHNFKVDFGVF